MTPPVGEPLSSGAIIVRRRRTGPLASSGQRSGAHGDLGFDHTRGL